MLSAVHRAIKQVSMSANASYITVIEEKRAIMLPLAEHVVGYFVRASHPCAGVGQYVT